MTGFRQGVFTDLHSHLVPGVDDGSRTLEDALEGIGRLRALGVGRLAVTPHLEGSLTRNPEALEYRLQEMESCWRSLVEGVAGAFPDVEMQRGYEVMLDVPDPDFSDPRTRLAGTDFVLAEWPRLQIPPSTPEVLDRLRNAGIRPIVAHPERYHGLDGELNLPGEWKRMGACLQVNYGSLAGRYGDAPRDRAFTFLERGWVDLFSTDFHGRPHLSIYLGEAREALSELGGEEQFDLLARVNPSRVLMGDAPLPVPPLELKQGFWEKLRSLLPGRERR
ncbi:tyrosine-protein phosphatase [Gemmatimonadota bacterium]